MGLLVDGVWQEDATRTTNGRFVRPTTSFRNFVTADGSPGPSGEGGFPAERGRYHLYISLACPWAHRTLIFRDLKNLDDVISVSIAEPLYGKTGWEFGKGQGGTADDVNGKSTLAEIYLIADPHYTGRVSVPVLWDKKRHTIVNNEFVRNHPHVEFGVQCVHQHPHRLLSRCIARRDRSHQRGRLLDPSTTGSIAPVSPPVRTPMRKRRAEFSLRSISSKIACHGSAILSAPTSPKRIGGYSRRWCVSTRSITATSNAILRRIADYPNLWNYLRDLYQQPRVAGTVSIDQIKRHYYGSQRQVNPTGIVPIGPLIDFNAPHDRARFE